MVYVKVKRKFGSLVSIRDYHLAQALESKQPLRIFLEEDKLNMTIPYEELRRRQFQLSRHQFPSKYPGGQPYELVDFSWQPDV